MTHFHHFSPSGKGEIHCRNGILIRLLWAGQTLSYEASFGSRDNTISMPSWGATIILLLHFWLLLSLVCWREASGLLKEVLEMLSVWAFLNWTCLGRPQRWSEEEQSRTKQTLVEFSSMVALTGIFNSKQWAVLCSKVGWHKKWWKICDDLIVQILQLYICVIDRIIIMNASFAPHPYWCSKNIHCL